MTLSEPFVSCYLMRCPTLRDTFVTGAFFVPVLPDTHHCTAMR